MKLWGIEPPQESHETDEDVEVWPDMRDAVLVFFNMGTQWRFQPVAASLGGTIFARAGLIYSEIRHVAAMLGLEIGPDEFRMIRIMEAEAVKASAERHG
jgi:hypothetical protein